MLKLLHAFSICLNESRPLKFQLDNSDDAVIEQQCRNIVENEEKKIVPVISQNAVMYILVVSEATHKDL